MKRERLGSRLGFILLSAGCAIGCGNVWKFPWMAGQYGGGCFVLIYLICLIILGLPCMTMEFAVGRAAQKSPLNMYQAIEKPGQKWHLHGYASLLGNFALMAFYTVVTGWMLYYFVMFATGKSADLTFTGMTSDWRVNVIFMAITVIAGFAVLCFNISGGLEKVTKIMMLLLFALLFVLTVRSITLEKASEGLSFYLVPDFKKINETEGGLFTVIVGAMNQAFFTLSTGMGSMAIFGSYIGKERSLMGESVRIIALDTLVAIMAGLIIFPSCATYNVDVTSGPALLFDTMATVFNQMDNGRVWGTLFFMFMVFAAFSTVLSVFETILACMRELIGGIKAKKTENGVAIASDENGGLISRPAGCVISGVIVMALAITTALGFNLWSGFTPFGKDSSFLDFWDFIISTNILPIGSLVFALFCCHKFGWGWDNFTAEANSGKGLKVKAWMKPYCSYVLPVIILAIYIYGLVTFPWT